MRPKLKWDNYGNFCNVNIPGGGVSGTDVAYVVNREQLRADFDEVRGTCDKAYFGTIFGYYKFHPKIVVTGDTAEECKRKMCFVVTDLLRTLKAGGSPAKYYGPVYEY